MLTQSDITKKEKGQRFFELIKTVVETCQKHNKKRLIVFNRTIRDNITSAEKYSSSNEFTSFKEHIEFLGCKIDILSSFITPTEKAKILENFNKPSETM